MARAPKVLRVVVNPFAHLDHEGRPACAVQHEPNPMARGTELKRYHGAIHHAKTLELRAPVVATPHGVSGDPRPSVHEHTFEFAYGEVLTLPDTRYYREHLTPDITGATSLLAADEATAKKLGRPFRDPALTIHETAEQAAKRWADANDGEEPEFVTVDHALEDDKLADVHPAHVRAARYLAKCAVARAEATAKHETANKAHLEQVAKANEDAAKAAADAAKPPVVPDLPVASNEPHAETHVDSHGGP